MGLFLAAMYNKIIVTGPVKVSTKVSIKTADQSYIAEASSKDSQDKDS